MNNVIEIRNLKKNYGKITAVDGISFDVRKNSLFAFLGVNGAGKSTTVNIISTFLSADGGSVNICGHKLGEEDNEIRKKIAVVFQNGLLDDRLTVEENLMCRGALYGFRQRELRKRVANALHITDLDDLSRRYYGKLSGGQKRRCDIARALVNLPEVLFLDEPTTGLDPKTRNDIWNMIKRLQSENNMTVFFSTHYMEEAAAADNIVVIDSGKIVAEGTPLQLKEQYSTDKLEFECNNAAFAEKVLTESNRLFSVRNNIFTVSLRRTVDAVPILNVLQNNILSFEVRIGTMDDAFLAITGKERE